MNRHTYISDAIKTDFSYRLDDIIDPSRRTRIKAFRKDPNGHRPVWTIGKNYIFVLGCVQAEQFSLPLANAAITLDRPCAANPTLCHNPRRIGHLHLRCYDLEDLEGDYPDIRRFSEGDAERFWGFVKKVRETVGDDYAAWTFSCEKGISSSVACAVALARWLGNAGVADTIDAYYLPNQHIVSVLHATCPPQ